MHHTLIIRNLPLFLCDIFIRYFLYQIAKFANYGKCHVKCVKYRLACFEDVVVIGLHFFSLFNRAMSKADLGLKRVCCVVETLQVSYVRLPLSKKRVVAVPAWPLVCGKWLRICLVFCIASCEELIAMGRMKIANDYDVI